MDKINKQAAKIKNSELFLDNNSSYLEEIRKMKIGSLIFALSPGLKKKYKEYIDADSTEEKAMLCAQVIDMYEETCLWRLWIRRTISRRDKRVITQQKGYKKVSIDYSPRKKKDYYSVVTVIKNEARYMREFVLFYQATGADRVYIYDNDSSDNIMEVLDPFIKSGYVVYRSIHGPEIQDYVYRDAVRKTKGKTKWLAIVDADEFLFSPQGDMPGQLKAYEQYPGIGANWVMYGPNGHVKRPEGLVMDNYTETYADRNIPVNRHIKSIVQPDKVFTVSHPHFAIYRGRTYAVDERGNKIGNYCAYIRTVGRAFTESHQGQIFRVNHYYTKSHEDLKEKCSRGFADGSGRRVFDDVIKMFDFPMETDYGIKPYADIVRKKY